MPYTKRIVHHNQIDELINYITNEEKTDNGLLVTGVNCSAITSIQEFKNTFTKFQPKGNRVGYHLIQSFSPQDKIEPEQAHEIGVRLCKELYPNYQAVVTTHIDRGHIHNHIAINSINLAGKKLNDKLSDKKEGLYAYKEKSDELAAEYGCYVLPKFEFDKTKKKQSSKYYAYNHQTWRKRILDEMSELKLECNSLSEFITKLFDLGYDVKYGKYISVKPQGKERFIRLKTLSDEFSEDNLRLYFNGYTPDYYYKFKKYSETDFNRKYVEYQNELSISLELTASIAIIGGQLPQFQKTRKKVEVRAEQVQEVLELLENENINSFDDLELKIKRCREDIHCSNIQIKKFEKENSDYFEIIEKAQTFIQLQKDYDYAQYYKSIDEKYKEPEQVKLYEEIKNELGVETISDAQAIIKENSQARIEINKMKSNQYELQQRLYKFDLLKEEQLLKSKMFLHNIKVGNNRIDYENCTDTQWCIKLPYCDDYVFIDKTLATYNHKYGYNTLFLLDDKLYQIYKKDENGGLQPTKTYNGVELEEYISVLKENNIEQHKEKEKN